MQLAQSFAGAQMLNADLDAAGANLTAYVARRGHALLVALINKDAGRDVAVSLSGLRGGGKGRLMRLSAPALDSRNGVVFENGIDPARAGHSVTVDAHGRCSVVLPRGSAALMHLDRFV